MKPHFPLLILWIWVVVGALSEGAIKMKSGGDMKKGKMEIPQWPSVIMMQENVHANSPDNAHASENREAKDLLTSKNEASIASGIEQLERAAQAGNPDAMAVLGQLHARGEHVALDLEIAVQYLTQAAANGIPMAQRELAFLYETGRGVTVNKPMALIYYEFAAKGGDLEAKMSLGYKYFVGDGVHQNCDKAATYYRPVAQSVAEEAMRGVMKLHTDSPRLMNDEEATNEEEDVVQYWQYSADSGDANAQVTMGTLHLRGGFGVEQNPVLAFQYFKQAADQGNIGGVTNLGLMYAKGYGVAQDNVTAVKYFRQAADKGYAHAQALLGHMYLQGFGVKYDVEEAVRLFTMSAEQRHTDGLLHLGNCHFYGSGIQQDYSKAIQYYMAAMHGGDLVSQFNLAQMHRLGLSVTRSCTTAVTLYKRVAERGQTLGMLNTAHDLYKEGDTERALYWYEKAAEVGFELAQSNAAWFYDNQDGNSSLPTLTKQLKAFEYYRKAAEQQNPIAHLKMGDYYYYGVATSVDHSKAAAFYRVASDMRNPQATFNLGYMHERGEGLPQDFHLAKRYYDMTVTYNPDAYVAAFLALASLAVHFAWASPSEASEELAQYLLVDGTDDEPFPWDVVLMFLLSNTLLILVLLRFRTLRRLQQQNQQQRQNQQ